MRLAIRMMPLSLAVLALLTPAGALAQEQVADSGDTAWQLAASALVLFMLLPGLALAYAGRAVSAGKALTAGLAVFAVTAAVSLLWILIGYSLAFSPTGGAYLGDGFNWMLNNLSMVRLNTTIPESVFALFQMGFACFAAALVIGSVVDRARFGWMLGFASLWSLLVYVPLAHWMWGGGWLGAMGALDFAGGAVVHVAAGVSALVAAIVLGKPQAVADAGHSSAVSRWLPAVGVAGAGMLWAGWFGFNGGSELAATDDAAIAIINTHVAASAAALVWLLLQKLLDREVSAKGAVMGALAGLVTITASAGFAGPGGAMIIGAIGALVCFFAARIVQGRLGASDANDLFAISGAGGITGMLLTGIFLSPALGGLGYDGNMTMVSQVIMQAIAVGVTILWAILGTLIAAFGAAVISRMRDDVPVG